MGVQTLRRHFVDNLRWICILLLFPYHAAMIYNCWGENFYIRCAPSEPISAVIIASYTWFMPLLFALAGASSRFAMETRSPKQYVLERVKKLLVPFAAGVLLLVPVQTYFAERFHNGYTGGYLAQYRLFFTKFGDLSGYVGGFTVGHLWFLLYLFVISLLALPVMRLFLNGKLFKRRRTPSLLLMLSLFLVPLVCSAVLEIGGKSLGEYFSLFLLGFFLFGSDETVGRLERFRLPLGIAAILLTTAKLVLYFMLNLRTGLLFDLFDALLGWVCILALIGFSKRWLNSSGTASAYLSKACFPVYLLHQSVLVAAAYFITQLIVSPGVQFALITVFSAALTFTLYELIRRIPYIRFLFGLKTKRLQFSPFGCNHTTEQLK